MACVGFTLNKLVMCVTFGNMCVNWPFRDQRDTKLQSWGFLSEESELGDKAVGVSKIVHKQ